MKKKRERPERQLHTLINTLSSYIINRDELGSLVGYAVINSLQNFSTVAGGREVRFEEVKAVYDGIDSVVRECSGKDGYAILCQMQTESDPYIDEMLRQKKDFCCAERSDLGFCSKGVEEPKLIRLIFDSLRRGKYSYQDIIRRKGLALVSLVKEVGPIYGQKNILNYDYQALERTFR